MYIGFDYGTANCAIATMMNGQPQLLPIENEQPYIASSLAAPNRESVSEVLFRLYDINPLSKAGEQLLRRAITFNRDEGIDIDHQSLLFGENALNHYLADPEETYFVKSPKSFLGASGLQESQIALFEDLVCAMMANIKQKGEAVLQKEIRDVVIGRPVNFQGIGGEKANHQAQSILNSAATRAGFKSIAFQYEPVAAGIEFEHQLTTNQRVLVVDIGGGTTDCSMIEMGPKWRDKTERSDSLLAHTGLRVGGNDLDIATAYQKIMPLFGKNHRDKRGLALPVSQFWNPVAINNVVAQGDFYARTNARAITDMIRNVDDNNELPRLLNLQQQRLGYHVVREAELMKIALSGEPSIKKTIHFNDEQLGLTCTQDEFLAAIDGSIDKIIALIEEAVKQSAVTPDTVFITGGSARSPLLRARIANQLPDAKIVGGDFFGSVTAGLARWAERCFK
ncbi:molecular chaperone [Thaumasiovibrio subtropicus]|uniref:molecular chaperone n=1 Tax=Thaumasiovibrio subtropicus TaxID=1891207 RepID=UPI000B35277E|nr:molecular chaperone [Thaumasiovibrio subtropicus]